MSRRARRIDVESAADATAAAAVPAVAIAAADPRRVVIEAISPGLAGGRFPAKRSVGESVEVTADIFADGHDALAAVLRYRGPGDDAWREAPMAAEGNDRWSATFVVEGLGEYEYALRA